MSAAKHPLCSLINQHEPEALAKGGDENFYSVTENDDTDYTDSGCIFKLTPGGNESVLT